MANVKRGPTVKTSVATLRRRGAQDDPAAMRDLGMWLQEDSGTERRKGRYGNRHTLSTRGAGRIGTHQSLWLEGLSASLTGSADLLSGHQSCVRDADCTRLLGSSCLAARRTRGRPKGRLTMLCMVDGM